MWQLDDCSFSNKFVSLHYTWICPYYVCTYVTIHSHVLTKTRNGKWGYSQVTNGKAVEQTDIDLFDIDYLQRYAYNKYPSVKWKLLF